MGKIQYPVLMTSQDKDYNFVILFISEGHGTVVREDDYNPYWKLGVYGTGYRMDDFALYKGDVVLCNSLFGLN